jgi:hypothetical protein
MQSYRPERYAEEWWRRKDLELHFMPIRLYDMDLHYPHREKSIEAEQRDYGYAKAAWTEGSAITSFLGGTE